MKGIYKIESPNGSIYIGQSTDIHKRWKSYYYSHGKNVSLINRSLIKHGFDNHSFSVLHELPTDVSKEVLTIYEQIYMDQFKSCGFKMLNICPAAGSTYGLIATEETKQKQRDAHKNRKPISQEARKKISDFHKGKPKSEAAKKKLSEHFKGTKHTDEAKLKMSISRKGKKFSDEHRKKIGKALSGRIVNDEIRHKMSVAQRLSIATKGVRNVGYITSEKTKEILRNKAKLQKRYPCSEKQKQQISLANTGAYRSPEMRAKISEGLKLYNKLKKENAFS